jgi:hypothetical protein
MGTRWKILELKEGLIEDIGWGEGGFGENKATVQLDRI